MAELLKELQAAEGGRQENLQVAEIGSLSSSKKNKKKKNAPKLGAISKQKPKVSESKSKGKCFTCCQKGH